MGHFNLLQLADLLLHFQERGSQFLETGSTEQSFKKGIRTSIDGLAILYYKQTKGEEQPTTHYELYEHGELRVSITQKQGKEPTIDFIHGGEWFQRLFAIYCEDHGAKVTSTEGDLADYDAGELIDAVRGILLRGQHYENNGERGRRYENREFDLSLRYKPGEDTYLEVKFKEEIVLTGRLNNEEEIIAPVKRELGWIEKVFELYYKLHCKQ